MPEDSPHDKSENDRWFVEKLHPHDGMLRAWLKSRFPAESDVEDIMQESYVRTLAAHRRNELRSPKAFLFATARNLALDFARHRQIAQTEPLVENEALFVLDGSDGIPEVVARNQELEMLTAAIQSLPDRCRQVFTLRKVYGMAQKEIAHKLGISEHTVSAQLTIGLQRCGDYMRRYRDKDKR